jgi:hypothetical protein
MSPQKGNFKNFFRTLLKICEEEVNIIKCVIHEIYWISFLFEVSSLQSVSSVSLCSSFISSATASASSQFQTSLSSFNPLHQICARAHTQHYGDTVKYNFTCKVSRVLLSCVCFNVNLYCEFTANYNSTGHWIPLFFNDFHIGSLVSPSFPLIYAILFLTYFLCRLWFVVFYYALLAMKLQTRKLSSGFWNHVVWYIGTSVSGFWRNLITLSSILRMEIAGSWEVLIRVYSDTQHHIAEDGCFIIFHCENQKSDIKLEILYLYINVKSVCNILFLAFL